MSENEVPQKPDDRRSSLDRRDDQQDFDSERRSGDERRKLADRRGFYYVFKYSNRDNVAELQKWLEENCEGAWDIGIPDQESVEKWGSYRVRFENQDDLGKLVKMLGVYWPDWLQ